MTALRLLQRELRDSLRNYWFAVSSGVLVVGGLLLLAGQAGQELELALADVLEAALDQGIPVTAENSLEGPYVFLAARRGFGEGVAAFLDRGLDPAFEGRLGQTLLSPLSAYPETVWLVDRLLEAGVDPDHRSVSDQTPLMTAARCCCGEAMERLLEAGADPEAVDDTGRSVLRHLIEGSTPDGRTEDPEQRAEWVGRLLDLGVDPVAPDRYGSTPLQAAAGRGRGAIVEILLADSPERIDSADAREALVQALIAGHDDVAEQLQDRGVPANFWASLLMGDRLGAEWALEREPWLITATRPSDGGIGPAGYAMKRGHVDLARWLLHEGADPAVRTFRSILFRDALEHDAPFSFFERMFEHGGAVVERPDGNGRVVTSRPGRQRRWVSSRPGAPGTVRAGRLAACRLVTKATPPPWCEPSVRSADSRGRFQGLEPRDGGAPP